MSPAEFRGAGSPASVKDYGAKGDGVTDDAAAINALMTSVAAAGGGAVRVPTAGTYVVGSTLSVPSGVTLEGDPFAGVRITASSANRGAVLKAKAGTALDPMISLVDVEGSALRNLTVDGQDIAPTCVTVGAFQTRVEDCEIKRALTQAIKLTPGTASTSHECWILNNLITQNARGTGVLLTGVVGAFQCHDNQIRGNVIRGATAAGIYCDRSGGNLIQANHIYDFPGNPVNMLFGVRVVGAGNVSVVDNYIDNIAGGPGVSFEAWTNNGVRCRAGLIAGNTFYTSGVMTDNTIPCILLTDNGGVTNGIYDISIRGNVLNADDTTANRWSTALLTTGTVNGVSFTDTHIYGAVLAWSGNRPLIVKGIKRSVGNFDTTTAVSENSGVLTVTGDGATQTFSTAHGLLGTPRSVVMTPSNSAARNLTNAWNTSSNGANVFAQYQVAPAAGTYTYNWYAEV